MIVRLPLQLSLLPLPFATTACAAVVVTDRRTAYCCRSRHDRCCSHTLTPIAITTVSATIVDVDIAIAIAATVVAATLCRYGEDPRPSARRVRAEVPMRAEIEDC